MSESGGTQFGSSMKTKEGGRLVRGEGQFLANLQLDGSLQAAFLRSPHPHARILHIDASAALARPGVHAVILGDEIVENTRPILSSLPMRVGTILSEDVTTPQFHALTASEAHFVGDPIAMVVADTRHIAEDALDDIAIEYEPLPAVVDVQAAMAPGSPCAWSDWESNVGLHFERSNGDVDGAFARAAHVVEHRFSMHRSGYPPLECLVAAADFDDRNGLTVWLNNQKVHVARVAIAEILGLPAALVRVIAPPDIGGAFGWKAAIYREPFAVAYAAKKLRRPVTWVQDRREALSTSHERDQIVDMAGAFDAAGRLLALRSHIIGDVGCGKVDQYYYLAPAMGGLAPPPYAIEGMSLTVDCVVTNKAPQVVNRPAGRMPFVFALERLLDRAALELGLDPAEIRRRSLISTRPFVTLQGASLDVDFSGVFERLLDEMDYDGLKQWTAAERDGGRFIGLGVSACYDHASPVPSTRGYTLYHQPFYASARVKIEVDGEVVVFAGDSPQGQSRETTVAQAVGDQLAVPASDIRVMFGDTALSPFNNHATHTHTAAHLAAEKLRQKVLRVGAHLLGAGDPSSCDLRDGHVHVIAAPDRRLSLKEIAHVTYFNPLALPAGDDPLLEETVTHDTGREMTASTSAHGCVVEVFPETGDFQVLDWWFVGDAGRIMNPLLFDGAIHGGFAAGISNTSFEEYSYDADGQFVSATMMDFLMAGATEIPPIKVIHHNSPAATSVLGFKKLVTEGVPNGVPSALAAAIEDALRPVDPLITALPITPDRVWNAIRRAAAKDAADAG